VASSEENILKHFFIKEGRVKKEDRALIKELDKIYAVTKTLNTNFEKIYGDSFEMGLASLAYHLKVAKDKSI